MAVEFDTTELRKLSVDLGKAGPEVARQVDGIIRKGALNIKTDMQREADTPGRFSGVASSITYETTSRHDGLEAAVGPEIGRGQGSLAFLAYEGDHTNGPVFPDPQGVLDRESVAVQEWIGRVAGGVL